MKNTTKFLTGVGMAIAMVTTGCVTDPVTGNKKISKAAIGGVLGTGAGYLLGDLIGGRNSRTAEIVGAGIGAVAGAGVGYYMDQQEKKLREQTAGTDVNVVRDGDQLVLDMPGDVTFALNSATVSPSAASVLSQVAQTLVQYPSTYIDVYGHTDSSGSAQYNQTLSEQRARSVANYLASRGVQQARMATQGFGETQLKCDESTEAGKRCNRRVEIRISPVTQNDVNAVR
ncbi:OmpA family protein [Sphingorhabdus soli]|uniref:OmpA family protein n=1 Tax=Flavisphingopyxis soli TaxID=2601267 RepID=A0A5C6UKE1_9SPHN|nr:OmpA family protein [Sphingorhabdus soli]TXC73542.1 OmpA family protein [Sphingorhabdus soli]